MSYYSEKIHKSDLLNYDRKSPWLSPELLGEKPHLNGILNRIHHTILLINFILTKRDKQVNLFRNKIDTDENISDISWYLVLFTESFFVYAKNMLNAYAELICETLGNFPDEAYGDFTKLWKYFKAGRSQDNVLSDYFQNRIRWYEILIQNPRNKLVIHDKKTSGYGWNDHGIDVYVGKNSDHDPEKNEKAITFLEKIISNHKEWNDIRTERYFHPMYRQIVSK